MKLIELLGRKIEDILIVLELEPYGLDKADTFLALDTGTIIGIPFGLADEHVWIRELDASAKSVFHKGRWWQRPHKDILTLKGTVICDIISYPDSTDKSFVLLDNSKLITEITMAPNGTGHAGLWTYNSLADVENKFGKEYVRLTDFDA